MEQGTQAQTANPTTIDVEVLKRRLKEISDEWDAGVTKQRWYELYSEHLAIYKQLEVAGYKP